MQIKHLKDKQIQKYIQEIINEYKSIIKYNFTLRGGKIIIPNNEC